MGVCEMHSGFEADVKGLKEDVTEIKNDVKAIRDRPPTWATFALTGMGGAIGYLIALLQLKPTTAHETVGYLAAIFK